MPSANEVPGSQARLLRNTAPCGLICCSSKWGSDCRDATVDGAVHEAGAMRDVIGWNREEGFWPIAT